MPGWEVPRDSSAIHASFAQALERRRLDLVETEQRWLLPEAGGRRSLHPGRGRANLRRAQRGRHRGGATGGGSRAGQHLRPHDLALGRPRQVSTFGRGRRRCLVSDSSQERRRCERQLPNGSWSRRACKRRAMAGSRYCRQHSPKEASGEVVYVAWRNYGGDIEVEAIEVAKRSEKQVRLLSGVGSLGYRVSVAPSEVSTSPLEALARLADSLRQKEKDAADRANEFRRQLAEVKAKIARLP